MNGRGAKVLPENYSGQFPVQPAVSRPNSIVNNPGMAGLFVSGDWTLLKNQIIAAVCLVSWCCSTSLVALLVSTSGNPSRNSNRKSIKESKFE